MIIDPERYGIREGINEVIVTTLSTDGKPNAAPIGIISSGGKLTVKIFNESQTCANIKDTGLLAANIVDDPVLFVQSALANTDTALFKMVNTKTGFVFPVLTQSYAWVLFETGCEDGSIAMSVELHPVIGDIISPRVRSINRGFNAVIEALVHATRYRVFNNEEYIDKIKTSGNIVKKCGGPREKEAYELIFELL